MGGRPDFPHLEWSFNEVKPEHIAKCGIGKPHANNNRGERLNGTLRERVKVQRGLGEGASINIADGHRVFYNFIRPHLALAEKTPAEKAGIRLSLGGNRWLELIKKASSSNFAEQSQASQ